MLRTDLWRLTLWPSHVGFTKGVESAPGALYNYHERLEKFDDNSFVPLHARDQNPPVPGFRPCGGCENYLHCCCVTFLVPVVHVLQERENRAQL